MGQLNFEAATAADTEKLAARFADAIRDSGETRLLVLLQGPLGAGKTTFVRGLLRRLGHKGPVPSPTYTLVESYDVDGLRVNHIDLYRLAGRSELEFLGWRELSDEVCLVEWPERVAGLAGGADIVLRLRLAAAGRSIAARGASETGRGILAGIKLK